MAQAVQVRYHIITRSGRIFIFELFIENGQLKRKQSRQRVFIFSLFGPFKRLYITFISPKLHLTNRKRLSLSPNETLRTCSAIDAKLTPNQRQQLVWKRE